MGFIEDIFNLAKCGSVSQLRFYLEVGKYTTQERSSAAVSSSTNGATPLFIACKNGHLDVVRYLIERWHVDIEKPGILTIHGKTKYVTPIWCAAAAGHLNIVKMLVKYNASIISTTCDETVLHAACFDGHFDTVKYLVQQGAKLDSNSCNTTPLLLAALNGHSQIVNYFFSAFNCTKEEKVDALELLGATFINKKHNNMETAVKYWSIAMEMRFEEPALKKPSTRCPLAKYINATEISTFHDLQILNSDPDGMKMQSLIIRDRILGQSHPSNIQEIKSCATSFNIGISIKLWMYVLDSVYDEEPFSDITYENFDRLTELFSLLMAANSLDVTLPVPVPPISFKDILHVFQRCLKEFERYLSSSGIKKDINKQNNLNNVLILSIHLLYIMCKIQPRLNTDENTELKKAAYKLVYLNPTTNKNRWTPLHLACINRTQLLSLITYPTSPYKFSTFVFPSPEIVDLLLEVGACPNAVDTINNTPLHIIATNRPCTPSIFKALLNHHAHLDFCNLEKKTPLQLAGNTSFLNIYPLQYTTLQCLSAKTIRKYKIAYTGVVHEALKIFLDSH